MASGTHDPSPATHAAGAPGAAASLRRYLGDRSAIVKTCALQALTELSIGDAGAEAKVVKLLEETSLNGTAAMKARSRKLLKRLQNSSRRVKGAT